MNIAHETEQCLSLETLILPPRPALLQEPECRFSIRRVLAGVAVGSGLVFGHLAIQRSEDLTEQRASAQIPFPRQLNPNPWPENVSVFAASTQASEAFLFDDYTHRFLRELKRSSTQDLVEAHQALETGLQNPLRGKIQLPVSSVSQNPGWKKDVEAERRVLLISGSGNSESDSILSGDDETHFRKNVESMKSVLAKEYHLRSEAFVILNSPSEEDVREVLRQFGAELSDGGEVLIYYAGHGDAIGGQTRQGEREGIIAMNDTEVTSEKTIKNFLREYLAHVDSAALIFDTCYSGAWIENRL